VIAALLGEFWPYLAAAGAALAGIVAAWAKGRRDARRDMEHDAMKGVLDDLDTVRRARRASDDPERLRDDDGFKRP
jgi:hypothetical protein